MSKYLITGATGGLGSQVVEFLLQRIPAEKIVALTRDPKKLQAFAEKGVEIREETILTRIRFNRRSEEWRGCCLYRRWLSPTQ